MDDEILACGGTIIQLKNKKLVHLVFATDGKQSPYSKESRNLHFNKVRINESITALKMIGIPEVNITFLNFPEKQLKNYNEPLTKKLLKIINEINPDFIFTPFRFDRHPDHLTLNKSSIKAYIFSHSSAVLLEYFVYIEWRLIKLKDIRKYIKPNLLIKIDFKSVSQIKRKVLDCLKVKQLFISKLKIVQN